MRAQTQIEARSNRPQATDGWLDLISPSRQPPGLHTRAGRFFSTSLSRFFSLKQNLFQIEWCKTYRRGSTSRHGGSETKHKTRAEAGLESSSEIVEVLEGF